MKSSPRSSAAAGMTRFPYFGDLLVDFLLRASRSGSSEATNDRELPQPLPLAQSADAVVKALDGFADDLALRNSQPLRDRPKPLNRRVVESKCSFGCHTKAILPYSGLTRFYVTIVCFAACRFQRSVRRISSTVANAISISSSVV